jgi:hypothetical protein
MLRSIAMAALMSIGCTHPHEIEERHFHPCDERGPAHPPKLPDANAYTQHELRASERQLLGIPRCTLADSGDPKRFELEEHDIQAGCERLTENMKEAEAAPCWHACIVGARLQAARDAFDRANKGLESIPESKQLSRCLATARYPIIIDAEAKAMWACLGNDPLPASFEIELTPTQEAGSAARGLKRASVTGTLPALGDRYDLLLTFEDSGCGQLSWEIEQIAPMPQSSSSS